MRVAAHRALAGADVAAQQRDHRVLRGHFVDGRGAHPVDQPAPAVRALVPGVHRVERGVALVDRQHRALDASRHLRVGDDDCDLDDAVALGRQPGHLEVDPDQVLVVRCESCRHGLRQRHSSPTLWLSLHLAMSLHRSTLLFAVALLASLAPDFWLATRQMRHVAAHRNAVPAGVRRRRLARGASARRPTTRWPRRASACWPPPFGSAVLLGWTLLGGLDALNQCCATRCCRVGVPWPTSWHC